MLTTKYKIGDTVYLPWATPMSKEQMPCPICYGKLYVTLTLGNGETQDLECKHCAPGFEKPTGVVDKWTAGSGVRVCTVVGLSIEHGVPEYRLRAAEGWSTTEREAFIYQSREEALDEAGEMLAIVREQEQKKWESQFTDSKGKLTWTAGYHRNQIRELERKLSWHRERLRQIGK